VSIKQHFVINICFLVDTKTSNNEGHDEYVNVAISIFTYASIPASNYNSNNNVTNINNI